MTFGWRTWPAEREQLVRQPGGALCGLINLFDIVAAVIAGGKIGEQEIGVSADRGEDVVEIVRHAARQPADGFHLLRQNDLFFQDATIRVSGRS